MSLRDDGGSAFPEQYRESDGTQHGMLLWRSGMSMRDYFAGQALVGLGAYIGRDENTIALNTAWARLAYQIADAMLVEQAR